MRHYIWHSFHWGDRPRDREWVDHRLALWRAHVLPQLIAMRPLPDKILVYCRSGDEYAVARWREQPVHVVLYDRDLLASDDILAADRDQDWIAWTRLDCDDLLAASYLRHLADIDPADGLAAMCTPPGLCYDLRGDRWGEWHHDSQPNSTIFIPGRRWQHREAAWQYAYCRHGEVRSRFRVTRLPTGMYCNLIHGDNTLNSFRRPFRPTGLRAETLAAEYPHLWRRYT